MINDEEKHEGEGEEGAAADSVDELLEETDDDEDEPAFGQEENAEDRWE
jgi:hypothetical protein